MHETDRGHVAPRQRGGKPFLPLDQLQQPTTQPEEAQVVAAVAGLEDHATPREGGRIRQRPQPFDIATGKARPNTEHEPGASAGRDVAGVRAGLAGDHLAGTLLQLLDPNERNGCLCHGRHHLRLHQRPAELGEVAGRIDERTYPEPRVDV